MNDLELMQALIAGKKMRNVDWEPYDYIHLVDGYIAWGDGEEFTDAFGDSMDYEER